MRENPKLLLIWHLVKCTNNSLQNTPMGLVFCWTELFYTYLCISCTKPWSVSLHPPVHTVFLIVNNLQLYRFHGFQHVLLECVICVITIFVEILFHNTPKELDEIQFTMEFWQENAEMASFFNDILNKRFLLLKIRLVLEDLFIATVSFIQVAFAWTFSLEICLVKTTFCEDNFDFGWFEYSAWSAGNFMGWIILYLFQICQLSCMWACFSPGFTFIHEMTSTSSE